MQPSTFVILYVAQPATSTEFYAQLLGAAPVEQSPTFAMFVLSPGVMLGLWGKDGVSPAPTAAGGGGELAFVLPNDATVDARHAEFVARGLPVIEAPTARDFGYAFTAVDPDGHRIRYFAPVGM